MNINAQPVGNHANRIVDQVVVIKVIARRHRMQHKPPVLRRIVAAGHKNLVYVVRPHGLALHSNAGGENIALQPAAGNREYDLLDRMLGHALGLINGSADRLFGLVHMDDDAALDAL